MKEYGVKALLNDRTCLKVADGKEWIMGFIKNNGRVWFHHGWQKFVDFYSIRIKYFLVFKYECRSSSFHVVIFDPTATEIEYPMKKICVHEAKEEVIDLDDHVIHLQSYPPGLFPFFFLMLFL